MPESLIYKKMKSIADDFSCGDWGSPQLLSPREYREQDREELQDENTRGLNAAPDKWVFRFTRGRVSDARGGPGFSTFYARAAFTPKEARDMGPDEICRAMIGVLAERQFHEVLEWAQLKTMPGVPLVDPHHMSDDLYNVVSRVANAVLNHASTRNGQAGGRSQDSRT